MRRPSGVTLMELIMAVLIGSVLSLAITRIFSTSVATSVKGTSHLTNAQNAAILLARIEIDLGQAMQILSDETRPEALQVRIEGAAGEESIGYEPAPDHLGVTRQATRILPDAAGGDPTQSTTYCRGLPTRVEFAPVLIDGRRAFFVTIRVVSPKGGEEYAMKRLFACPNLPENKAILTGNWLW